MPTIAAAIEQLENSIALLKAERDRLIRAGGFDRAEIERILQMRSPRRNICQLLRELHTEVEEETQRDKIEQCLLIAKKMDDRLMHYAGRQYGADWYDENGQFKA